jgi:NNP family nitrate/nitrite transporter-like MFS transporter
MVHRADPSLYDFTFGNQGRPYDDPAAYSALLLTLPAVAGLTGATMRIPNSFAIAVSGGRTVATLTALMLLVPVLGGAAALANPHVSFGLLIFLAALSGIGGGAFASSMSNISFFFPKRLQGLALGLNAGLGNLGVSLMQFLAPLALGVALFGAWSGAPVQMPGNEAAAPRAAWVQNVPLLWAPPLALLAVAAWRGMHNLPQHGARTTLGSVGNFLWLTVLGLAGGAIGVALLLAPWGNVPDAAKILVTLMATVAATLGLMRYATPAALRGNLQRQFAIFGNKHNWIMTWLYTMTFGSFIGYANVFPMLLDLVFGNVAVGTDGQPLAQAVANPHAPPTARYIWIGAAVGALMRPIGGWLADRWGGARVTQWDTWIMTFATVGAGYVTYLARTSPQPERYFLPFLALFVLLFAATGIGNGSTFRMIAVIFPPGEAGPVLGWTSAVAAYGAFLIPTVLATQIRSGAPEYALYGFALYYATCLGANWYYYARRGAATPC